MEKCDCGVLPCRWDPGFYSAYVVDVREDGPFWVYPSPGGIREPIYSQGSVVHPPELPDHFRRRKWLAQHISILILANPWGEQPIRGRIQWGGGCIGGCEVGHHFLFGHFTVKRWAVRQDSPYAGTGVGPVLPLDGC